MIDVYSWPTPNGHKVHIMLEECGLPYAVHPIDIRAGDQFDPAFLAISPNNKIPAIVDSDGPDGKPISLFESGAILIYLAAKTGKFMPRSTRGKYEVLQWLMFQMGGVGPMLGQTHHFRMYAPETIAYAIDRYTNEAKRLYRVLDRRLEDEAVARHAIRAHWAVHVAAVRHVHKRERRRPVMMARAAIDSALPVLVARVQLALAEVPRGVGRDESFSRAAGRTVLDEKHLTVANLAAGGHDRVALLAKRQVRVRHQILRP